MILFYLITIDITTKYNLFLIYNPFNGSVKKLNWTFVYLISRFLSLFERFWRPSFWKAHKFYAIHFYLSTFNKSIDLTWYCLAQKRAWRHLSTASSVRGPGRWMRSSKAVDVAGPGEDAVAFERHRCWLWLLFAFFTSAMMLEIGGDRRHPNAVTQDTMPSSGTPLWRFDGSKSEYVEKLKNQFSINYYNTVNND